MSTDGPTDRPPPTHAATVIVGDGRYRLGRLLGRGGMAEVRQAEDLRLGRTVAVKRLRADLAGDPTFQARFRREAQSAASLNHSAIVAVYDTGEETSTSGDSLPYIVMEYVEGRTLREILREGRKLLPERALRIVADVLGALDYSHRAGIIHRDIKPANVMLTPTGDVKVMDFGIARAIADTAATMTQTAAVVGTAQYLSPEQARGEQVDARSDVYSTGCVLYELLTRRPPFVGDSPVSVAYQHVREEPEPPSRFEPAVPPEIDAITLKALSKSVESRYQSAAEMRADIERAIAGRPVEAPSLIGAAGDETETFLPPPPAAAMTPTTPTATTQVHRYGDPPPNRPVGRYVAIVLLVLLLLAGAVVAGVVLISKNGSAKQVLVPDVVQQPIARAETRIENANLRVGRVTPVNSTTVRKGEVLRQSEAPNTYVDENTVVDLTVSAGVAKRVVPDVSLLKLKAATAELTKLKFQVIPVADPRSSERKNQVTHTDPPPGTEQALGAPIKVYYSTGYVKVRSVVGMKESDARNALASDGFRVVTSDDATSTADQGTVVRQDPPAGERQPYGSTVVIYVSTGPPTTPSTSTPTTETTSTGTTTTPPAP
jgi:beta-lactam-binding protein with PASTA domain/tRNA A-37 threonylcarbamoyl transferase component Bud32